MEEDLVELYAERIVEAIDYDIYKEWVQIREDGEDDFFISVEAVLEDFMEKIKYKYGVGE